MNEGRGHKLFMGSISLLLPDYPSQPMSQKTLCANLSSAYTESKAVSVAKRKAIRDDVVDVGYMAPSVVPS